MAFLFFGPQLSKADISTGLDAIYFSDSMTTTSNPNVSKTYYDASFMLSLYNKSNFFLGASFIGYSSTDTDSSAVQTTWSSQDYGFAVKYFLGKQKAFSVSASYLISSTATYKLGSNASEVWSGTGIQGKLSYQPQVNDELYMGVSLVYYSGSYTTSRSGSTLATISKTKTYIVPTLSVSYNF